MNFQNGRQNEVSEKSVLYTRLVFVIGEGREQTVQVYFRYK